MASSWAKMPLAVKLTIIALLFGINYALDAPAIITCVQNATCTMWNWGTLLLLIMIVVGFIVTIKDEWDKKK